MSSLTDVDECLSIPCHNEAECIDLVDQFECICPAGYDDITCQLGKHPFSFTLWVCDRIAWLS